MEQAIGQFRTTCLRVWLPGSGWLAARCLAVHGRDPRSRARGRLQGLPVIGHLSGEEVVQSFGSLFWNLFREEMAGIHGTALHICTPVLPECDGSGLLD